MIFSASFASQAIPFVSTAVVLTASSIRTIKNSCSVGARRTFVAWKKKTNAIVFPLGSWDLKTVTELRQGVIRRQRSTPLPAHPKM
jgi:hypothetical protein